MKALSIVWQFFFRWLVRVIKVYVKKKKKISLQALW